MRIRHLDMLVHTEAPDTWAALVRQRRLWWAGTFRHWWINLDRNRDEEVRRVPLRHGHVEPPGALTLDDRLPLLRSRAGARDAIARRGEVVELARRRRRLGRYQFGYRRDEVLRDVLAGDDLSVGPPIGVATGG